MTEAYIIEQIVENRNSPHLEGIIDMLLSDFRKALLQQCNVSGSLPPVDNRVMFADYIQRCVIEGGQMTYPSLKDAIKAWDETTERFGGNDR